MVDTLLLHKIIQNQALFVGYKKGLNNVLLLDSPFV